MVNPKKRRPPQRYEKKARAGTPAPVLAEDAAFESIVPPVADEPRLVRLNKFLADHGVASRRKCDELIAGGKVSVDGQPVSELGIKIEPEKSAVEIDGFVLK